MILITTMQLLIVIFVALVGSAVADNEEDVEDLSKPTPQLIEEANYTGETHFVTTEDGYILAMHRISGGPKSPAAENKPVAFLMHGLLLSSADWIITGSQEAFGYSLSDAGYDVWMGNARGNTYSKNHTDIDNLSDDEFWNFSWHEIGLYDLPAMIDYVLNVTGQKQVIYIGHSQGTTSFFVMGSLKPEYNDKIKVMFGLAPVAYIANAKSPLLRLLASIIDVIKVLADVLGINEFLPSDDLFTQVEASVCSEEDVTQGVCLSLLYSLFGSDIEQTNRTILPTILGHFPAGASTNQIIHYGQLVKSGYFRQYDHGWIKNLLVYGSLNPPNYSLSKVITPVHLMYSENDLLADTKDVKKLYPKLGNGIELIKVVDILYNHLDFLWGTDAKEYVYDYILTTLESKYND